jgi:hypothetical protein
MSLEIHANQDERARSQARRKVSEAASEGAPLDSHFSSADLTWAFEGYEGELERLRQKAISVRAAKTEEERKRQEKIKIASMTTQILKEWEEQERRERGERARAEARRRLGLEAE